MKLGFKDLVIKPSQGSSFSNGTKGTLDKLLVGMILVLATDICDL